MSDLLVVDTVVIGSGYGGLIVAAILAREGQRVLVVDNVARLGGTCRSTFTGEVFTPFGSAGSRDTSDMFVLMSRKHRFGKAAAERAGVTLPWVGPIEPVMRVHVLATGEVGPLGGGLANYATRVYGLDPELVDDLKVWWREILTLEPTEYLDVALSTWLEQIPSPELRDAFTRLAHVFDTLALDVISTGRFAQSMQTPIEHYYFNDPDAPGMAAVPAAYERAIVEHGGEVALGREIYEILTDDHGAVTGVALQDDLSEVTTVECDAAVYAQLPHRLRHVLGRREPVGTFTRDAEILQQYVYDVGLLECVLTRLPTRRSDGEVEDYPGWCRILRGLNRDYGGGWWFPSTLCPALAPTGKAVLEIGHSSGVDGVRPFLDLAEARSRVESVFDYLREFYVDIDDLVEHRSFFIHRPPNLDSWRFANAPRLPIVVPGFDGLFHVSSAANVTGVVQDIDANAAMQVADLILAR